MRLIVAALAAVLVCTCATPLDTARRNGYQPERGARRGCYIYCSDHRPVIFRRQHLCPGGTRWFMDLWITGETRDDYLTRDGNYDKRDVELLACDAYIRTVINARAVEQRGQYPGTDPQGNPDPNYRPPQ